MDDDIIDKLSRDTYYCWGCVEWGCTACDCDCHGWEGTHAAAKAEIERLRAVERRSHDLWWLAYHHGPVTLTVRGGHDMHRTVTVNGISYNVDDPADVALLEARRG